VSGAAPTDVLCLGPHPDDIEIGMAATIAKHVSLGHRVGLCDLTRGEMGSNGTPEERVAEGEAARAVLGAAWRENLELPDRALIHLPSHLRRLVELIRRCRPSVVAAPYWDDRHPDHGSASRLITEAVFTAALRRYETGEEPWKPRRVCFYFINDSVRPTFVVDVTEHYATKRRALDCHRSQFAGEGEGAVATRLTSPLFRQLIESRDAQFGALTGVTWAEGFLVREMLVKDHLIE
jgi:bacillithiol biosynthesis deacetylase BshB1